MATLVLSSDGDAAHRLLAQPGRPWLSLYGVRLRAPEQRKPPQEGASLIQRLLPDEILLVILSKLSAADLGCAACVCPQWRRLADAPTLWKTVCYDGLGYGLTKVAMAALVRSSHRNSWKDLFLDRPRLRFDGVYCSRNTYIKQGIREWAVHNAVHMVCYYRYYLFKPDGTFVYRNSPEPLTRVLRSLQNPTHRSKRGPVREVYSGRFRQEHDAVHTSLSYDNASATQMRTHLRLQSTSRGANNRLAVEAFYSWDRVDGAGPSLLGDDHNEADDGERRRSYQRGLNPYVFVSFHQAHSSPINLPVTQMDYFIPG